ncbi:MAG: Na+/H+ antiporter NhaA, partial [Thermomicrobiales bacterium]|nr:Na+/H+ antiporter NhaA [Thermomicrobiales bacterium]
MLIVATLLALVWANSPWRSAYERLADTVIGPAALHLDLSLATWAADGLLAIFFFVVGLEIKHELVAGSLRDAREAAVPVLAAVGGMAAPASTFLIIALLLGDHDILRGWAIPTATDIAFALAVLAIFGRGLPSTLRLFLLTLAVVDDLLAIVVIALFYTESIDRLALAAALAGVGLFAWLARRSQLNLLVLGLVAFVTWALVHESGVHATIAGALLGLSAPATPIGGELKSRVLAWEHAVRPFSTTVALPVFALFSAGVNVVDGESLHALAGQPVVPAIVAALVLGKLCGVLGTTFVVTNLTPLRLPDAIGMRDLLPIGFLTGIGFTVSLLIAELSFEGTPHAEEAKVAVLTGTTMAALLAAITLRWDARKARSRDMNRDDVVD